jgi:hypothetical protein
MYYFLFVCCFSCLLPTVSNFAGIIFVLSCTGRNKQCLACDQSLLREKRKREKKERKKGKKERKERRKKEKEGGNLI